MDATPKPTMKSSVLRAVLRTWRALKNATTAFFNRLLGGECCNGRGAGEDRNPPDGEEAAAVDAQTDRKPTLELVPARLFWPRPKTDRHFLYFFRSTLSVRRRDRHINYRRPLHEIQSFGEF